MFWKIIIIDKYQAKLFCFLLVFSFGWFGIKKITAKHWTSVKPVRILGWSTKTLKAKTSSSAVWQFATAVKLESDWWPACWVVHVMSRRTTLCAALLCALGGRKMLSQGKLRAWRRKVRRNSCIARNRCSWAHKGWRGFWTKKILFLSKTGWAWVLPTFLLVLFSDADIFEPSVCLPDNVLN